MTIGPREGGGGSEGGGGGVGGRDHSLNFR